MTTKKRKIKIPKDYYKTTEANFAWSLEMVLVGYKIGKIPLEDAVRVIKIMFKP